MKVEITHEKGSDHTYEALEILIDGTYSFSVHYDANLPEDNNLDRNFSDCFDIPDMIKRAYDAGKRNEPLEINYFRDDYDI